MGYSIEGALSSLGPGWGAACHPAPTSCSCWLLWAKLEGLLVLEKQPEPQDTGNEALRSAIPGAGGPGGPRPSPEVSQLCEGTDLGAFTLLAQQQHTWKKVPAVAHSKDPHEQNTASVAPRRPLFERTFLVNAIGWMACL